MQQMAQPSEVLTRELGGSPVTLMAGVGLFVRSLQSRTRFELAQAKDWARRAIGERR